LFCRTKNKTERTANRMAKRGTEIRIRTRRDRKEGRKEGKRTPWGRVLLGKSTVAQPYKELPEFDERSAIQGTPRI
jgi:hypothetical protein